MCAIRGSSEFHKEGLVLFKVFVINYVNRDILYLLAMFKHQSATASVIILAVHCCLINCFPMDIHLPVSPLAPFDLDKGFADAFFDDVAWVLKREGSRL